MKEKIGQKDPKSSLLNCPVCAIPLIIKSASGRKSNKSFIMLVCPKDGRHFRAFITDQSYVKKVLDSKGRGTGTSKVSV
jgi:hypothetical protein